MASFETECPRCGAAIRDGLDDTMLGRSGEASPDARPNDGRPADRTAFGIHVLDVATGGTAAPRPPGAPSDDRPSATSTFIGQRAPGFGVVPKATAVGLRAPMTPRDADSTTLNALGSASQRAAVEETLIVRPPPDAGSTMMGVSLQDDAPEHRPAPAPRQFADDWLDDISDYLKDHEDELARGLRNTSRPEDTDAAPVDTPAPLDDAPAFGIVRRSRRRASTEADEPPSDQRAPEAPDPVEESQPVARIKPRPHPARAAASPGPPADDAPSTGKLPPAPADPRDTAELARDDAQRHPEAAGQARRAASSPADALPSDRSLGARARSSSPEHDASLEALLEPSGTADLGSAPIGAALEPSSAFESVGAMATEDVGELETAAAADFLTQAAARQSADRPITPPRATRPMRPMQQTASPERDATSTALWAAVAIVALALVAVLLWTLFAATPTHPAGAPPASPAVEAPPVPSPPVEAPPVQ